MHSVTRENHDGPVDGRNPQNQTEQQIFESTGNQAVDTLIAFAKICTQETNTETLINTMLENLRSLTRAEAASIHLIIHEPETILHDIKGSGNWEHFELLPFLALDEIDYYTSENEKPKESSNKETTPAQEQKHQMLFLPIIASGKVIGHVDLRTTRTDGFSQEEIRWAEALIALSGASIYNNWLQDQVSSGSKRLQVVTRKLVEVQEKERAYIARELHDEAGQLLSALKMSTSRLEQDPSFPPSLIKQMQGIKDTADSALENLHRLALDLRPAVLDHLGLVAALEQYVGNLQSEKLSLQFKASKFEGKRLPLNVEVTIYRIVQEALTNVVRHANASNVGVLLEWKGGYIKAFIEDDGVGFTLAQIDKTEHIGLLSMQERAEIIGGKLSVESSPDKGTTIILEVPDGYPNSDCG